MTQPTTPSPDAAGPAKEIVARKTITVEQYEELTALIAEARAAGAIEQRLVKLAEDVTEDRESNSHTFDVCCNDTDATVDDLLQRLGVTVEATNG